MSCPACNHPKDQHLGSDGVCQVSRCDCIAGDDVTLGEWVGEEAEK